MVTVDTRNYEYILQRYVFEKERSLDNAAFMLNEHLKDEDDSFLNSEIFKRIIKRTEEAHSEQMFAEVSVICKALDIKEDKISERPQNYHFIKNYSYVIIH